MARKKPDSPGDPQSPGMTDAAGMLATFAAGVLGQPESRSHATDLKLSRPERAILIGVPGLDAGLKERLDIPSTGVKSFRFTLDELARICLALSEALLDAGGREIVKLLKVTGKVTDRLDQAIDEVEQAGTPQRAAPKARRDTPKSQAAKAAGVVYQLKVTLKDIRPPIWRRLLVPDCSLAELHEVIQVAMGWENYHLYSFEAGGVEYCDDRGGGELDMEDASRARLSRVAPKEKAKFRYTYDFGDNWQHEVLVEKLLPPEEGQAYPACLKGKRACPPEDVGGAWGYMEYADAIRDPEHEQHAEFLQWRGEFNPEAFDIDAVNQELRWTYGGEP